jgi:hypothetical protein
VLEETSRGDLRLVEIQVKVEICCVVTCFHKSFGGPPKFVVLCLFLPHAYISLFNKGFLEALTKWVVS